MQFAGRLRFTEAAAEGKVLAPAKSLEEMARVAFNNQVNAAMCAFFMIVAITLAIAAVGAIRRALASPTPTARETPVVYREGVAYA